MMAETQNLALSLWVGNQTTRTSVQDNKIVTKTNQRYSFDNQVVPIESSSSKVNLLSKGSGNLIGS